MTHNEASQQVDKAIQSLIRDNTVLKKDINFEKIGHLILWVQCLRTKLDVVCDASVLLNQFIKLAFKTGVFSTNLISIVIHRKSMPITFEWMRELLEKSDTIVSDTIVSEKPIVYSIVGVGENMSVQANSVSGFNGQTYQLCPLDGLPREGVPFDDVFFSEDEAQAQLDKLLDELRPKPECASVKIKIAEGFVEFRGQTMPQSEFEKLIKDNPSNFCELSNVKLIHPALWVTETKECAENLTNELRSKLRSKLSVTLTPMPECERVVNKPEGWQEINTSSEVLDPTEIYKPEDIIEERQHTHGDFDNGARIINGIQDLLRCGARHEAIPPSQKLALDMIAVKLGRIVNGNPNHADSWKDIGGYASLGKDVCDD